jgi:hypothetical protein
MTEAGLQAKPKTKDPRTAPDTLLRDLARNSYEIVKSKYNKKK